MVLEMETSCEHQEVWMDVLQIDQHVISIERSQVIKRGWRLVVGSNSLIEHLEWQRMMLNVQEQSADIADGWPSIELS